MAEVFQKKGTTLQIYVPKELDHHNAEQIRTKADELLEQQNIQHIIFDFKDTSFMDSSGIGVIMGRYRNLQMCGGDVMAIHVNDRIYKILYLSGVHKIIEISRKREWNNIEE